MRSQLPRCGVPRLLVLAMTATAAALGCGGGDDGNGPPPAPTGRIAFQSHRTGSDDVWIMREDGANPLRLTTDPADDTEPALSADGTRIVFSSDRGGDFELWTASSQGGVASPLTADSGISRWPSWHPGGTMVVYERQYLQTQAQIWRIDATGTGNTLLVQGGARFPAGSPDGNKLAWVQGGMLQVGDADGGNPVPLTAADAAPAWSPDGSMLAFEHQQQIVVIGVDGSGRRNLTNRPRGSIQPTWSPDGTKIAFACDLAVIQGDVNDEICVLPQGGGAGIVNLTNLAAPDFRPRWVDP